MCILTHSKCNEQFIDVICIIYRPEKKKFKKEANGCKWISVKVKTKNALKCDYFPASLYVWKMHNLQTIKTPKKTKNN